MEFLPYSEDSNTSGSKFVLSCKDITNDEKTTKSWLKNISALSIIPKYKAIDIPNKKLLEGILHQNNKVVVKIANVEEDIEKEWDVYTALKNVKAPGILQYYCFFRCNDDIMKYNKNQPSLCDGTGDSLQVLVMEYVNGKSFKNYDWFSVSQEVFQSCLRQTILSLVNAFLSCGFIHGDFHLDNVLIQKTVRKRIQYDNVDKIVELLGWQTKLMDFELSRIDCKDISYLWKDLYCFFNKLGGDLWLILDPEPHLRIVVAKLRSAIEDKVKDINFFYEEIMPLYERITFSKNKQKSFTLRGGKPEKPYINRKSKAKRTTI